MELSYKEEVGVGAMVILGLVVLTVGMFWLTGRSITSKGVAVRVVFANVQGLKEGDPVRVSGVKKGRVGQVRLVSPGKVTVTLELDPEVRPHVDATATVAAADFLGAKFVDYSPGASEALLPPGKMIDGGVSEDVSAAAQRAVTNLGELIEEIRKGIRPAQLADDIHNTLVATQRGMSALSQASKGPAVEQATQTLKAVERVMVRIDTLLGASNPAATGKRLDTLSTNLARLTTRLADATGSLKNVLDKMDRGEGTLGKMASDTLLYRNLNETLTSLTTLMNDLRERPGRYLTVKVF